MDWREALRDEALSFCTADADEPASKEVLVEDSGTLSDQEEVDIKPVESIIKSTAEAITIMNDLQRFASSQLMVVDLMKISQHLQNARLAEQKQSLITQFLSQMTLREFYH